MTGDLNATWTVTPLHAPRPIRHCGGCGGPQRFNCSGRIRLNANGRKLDAWLIYKCERCDRTWNRPLLERVPVTAVAPADLTAMEASAPDWVNRHAFDLADLRRLCSRVEVSDEPSVKKPKRPKDDLAPSRLHLSLSVEGGVGVRVDRFLSRELPLSRSRLQTLWKAGDLSVTPIGKRGLRSPIYSVETITICADKMEEAERRSLIEALYQ